MSRDISRSDVYAAEDLVFSETLFGESIGPRGVTMLVDLLNANAWWASVGTPVIVEPTRRESTHSSAIVTNSSGVIRLSLEGENAATVAHEAAHILANKCGGTESHGALFRAADVDVVSVICGETAAARLQEAFLLSDLSIAKRLWDCPSDSLCQGLGLFGSLAQSPFLPDHSFGQRITGNGHAGMSTATPTPTQFLDSCGY